MASGPPLQDAENGPVRGKSRRRGRTDDGGMRRGNGANSKTCQWSPRTALAHRFGNYLVKNGMRQNNQSQGQKRGRNRNNNNRRGGGGHRQAFDSNGPSVRIRGTASQIHEKYLTMARDASSSGDRVLAESYYQHAEHYYRIVNQDAEARQARMAARMQAEQEFEGDSSESSEEESDVEVTVTASAPAQAETGEAEAESEGVSTEAAGESDEEEAPPAPKPAPRRRRSPRAKAPTSPAELAAAAESAGD